MSNAPQLDLFATPIEAVPEKGLSIDERFERFIAANPHVYRAFVSLAREYLRATGRHRVGAKAIFEKMRWEYSIRSKVEAGEPALNNSYVSRLARLAATNEPDLRDAFEFRALRSLAA